VGRRLPAYRDDSEQNVSRSRPVIREYRERAVERRLFSPGAFHGRRARTRTDGTENSI
jgi:hypothetical protein